MTKHQKMKNAKHNAEKDAKRRRLTVAEMEKLKADVRRQEAEANARLQEAADGLEDTWTDWTATYNLYTVPRLSAGFYYAALQAAKKRLIKSQVALFMDELSEAMQEVINAAGADADEAVNIESVDKQFNLIKEKLEAEGYAVPEWAQLDDFDKLKAQMKGGE